MKTVIFEQGKELAKAMVVITMKEQEHEQKIKELIETGSLNFDIFNEDGEYQVQTEFCQMGGCMSNWRSFDTNDEALRFAAEQTLLGRKPSYGGLCSDCRADLYEMQM
ncbi:hypothetical protein CN918_30795 [Priestia megaterium]|nr:hypothetical protein CN918_30795 [Priestia megaterium]